MLDLEPIKAREKAATEEWRAVPGYVGLYDVSSLGRVRSYLRPGNYKNKKLTSPRIMSEHLTRGYKTVALTRDGRYKSHRVHRLVLESFVGTHPDGFEAAHLNGDYQDNRSANLIWASHRENEGHKRQHGTDPKGERNGLAKLAEWEVAEIKYLLAKGIPQAKLARLFDVSRSVVNEVAAGSRWGHVPARSDIPALIAEVERQQRALMEIRGRLYEGGDIGNDGLDAITLPFSPQAGVERLRGEIDGAGE